MIDGYSYEQIKRLAKESRRKLTDLIALAAKPGPCLRFQRAIVALVHFLLALLGVPEIVCLCGSTAKALEAFRSANVQETLASKIVLSIGCDTKSDTDLFGVEGEERERIKQRLDRLHLYKILMAHEVYILNQGGYLGDSTRRELAYARQLHKRLRWLEPEQARGTAYHLSVREMSDQEIVNRYARETLKLRTLNQFGRQSERFFGYPNTLMMNRCRQELERRGLSIPLVNPPGRQG